MSEGNPKEDQEEGNDVGIGKLASHGNLLGNVGKGKGKGKGM